MRMRYQNHSPWYVFKQVLIHARPAAGAESPDDILEFVWIDVSPNYEHPMDREAKSVPEDNVAQPAAQGRTVHLQTP